MTKKQRFCRKEKQMKKSEIFCFLENRAGDYGSRRAALSSKFMEMRPEVRYSAPKPLSSYSFVLEMRNTQKPANVWTWFRETLPNDDLPLYPDMESFLQIKLPASFYDFASSLKGSQKKFAICAYIVDRNTGTQAKLFESNERYSSYLDLQEEETELINARTSDKCRGLIGMEDKSWLDIAVFNAGTLKSRDIVLDFCIVFKKYDKDAEGLLSNHTVESPTQSMEYLARIYLENDYV